MSSKKKIFMSVELRALWVFSQGASSKDVTIVTSRRFASVELRFRRSQEQFGHPYDPIPCDRDVVDEFRDFILHESEEKLEPVKGLSESFSDVFRYPVFKWNSEQDKLLEKPWPLGPLCSLRDGKVWPFIFISTSGDYSNPPSSDRFIVAAVVSAPGPRRPLIEMPEVTAGFGVLEELSSYLPSSPSVSSIPACSARFQFYLKSALPFGSPIVTSLNILEQLNTSSVTRADQAYSQNTSNHSSRRVPSWRPLPHQTEDPKTAANGQPSLSSSVVIKISERLVCKIPSLSDPSATTDSECTIIGTLEFDSDISGTPEITLPLSHSGPPPIITLHQSARVSEIFDDKDEKIVEKISFIPPTSKFTVAKYFYKLKPSFEGSFPIRADFNLMQISQSKFRFSIALDHKILFQYLFVRFRVFDNPSISKVDQFFTHVECSARSKIEILNSGEIQWTLKNPSTFTLDGEYVEGVIELDTFTTPFDGLSSNISKFANCFFELAGRETFGSHFSVNPKLVAVFPHSSKGLTVKTECSVKSENCVIINSATSLSEQLGDLSIPDILEDCIVYEPESTVVV